MTQKEEVITAFNLDVPNRLPVSIMGGGVWTISQSGNTFLGLSKNPKKMADVIVKTNNLIKSGIVFVGSGYNNFHIAALGGLVKEKASGAPYLDAPLISNVEDLKDLDLESMDTDIVVETIRDATANVVDSIGDRFMVTTTSWGPFTWACQIMGIEGLMINITRDPGLVKEVLDFSVKAILKFYKPLLDAGVIEMVSLAEPSASGNLISREHYKEFTVPYICQISKEIRKKGAYTFLHICGIINDRIEEVGESGVDCVSLDSNVDLGYAKEILGRKMCIAGNVDPINVMANGSHEDVINASKRCIELAASEGGFILMPGCDLSLSVPMSNIKALISMTKTWRPS